VVLFGIVVSAQERCNVCPGPQEQQLVLPHWSPVGPASDASDASDAGNAGNAGDAGVATVVSYPYCSNNLRK